MAALRVLVVDDHRVVRAGTRRIIEEGGMVVVAEAETAEEAIELVTKIATDVVLADVRLPGMSGIELTAAIRKSQPRTQVLILSSYVNVGYARAALAAGAAGYLVKTATDEELLAALSSAASGVTVLDPAISYELLNNSAGQSPLTEREREVVGLVAEGLSNKAIAQRLSVSTRTIDAHLGHLFTKLGLTSRAELVAWAARHGMIEE